MRRMPTANRTRPRLPVLLGPETARDDRARRHGDGCERALGDPVRRAGGATALHAARGIAVTVVCLSASERGGSVRLGRREGTTLDRVENERKEAEAAAQRLGVANIRFRGPGDCPLTLIDESLPWPVDVYRAVHPPSGCRTRTRTSTTTTTRR